MKKLLAITLLIASTNALAQTKKAEVQRPDAANVVSSDRVVAIAVGDDIDDAVLVGPSGQVYAGKDGAWTRTTGGGVAGDVAGAAFAGGELIVAGKAFPAYRRDGAVWFALRLGERGRTILGAGPVAALALGGDIHVHTKGKWKKVGGVSGKVNAVWASSDKAVWASTDKGLFRLRGGFARVDVSATQLVGGRPYALDPDGLRDLTARTAIPATVDGNSVTLVAGAGHPLHVVADTGAGLVLARVDGKHLKKIADVPGAGRVAAMAVDAIGDVLIAFADGALALRRGDAWTSGTVADALPADGRGPHAARTR